MGLIYHRPLGENFSFDYKAAAIGQSLIGGHIYIYGCSFVTYGHPEGSAAGDITIITIIWNDVFK